MKLLETVILAGMNMRAQQVNQNMSNTLLITNQICLRGKFWHPLHFCKRKIIEAFFMTKLKSDLNDEIEHHALSLFQHGVT